MIFDKEEICTVLLDLEFAKSMTSLTIAYNDVGLNLQEQKRTDYLVFFSRLLCNQCRTLCIAQNLS